MGEKLNTIFLHALQGYMFRLQYMFVYMYVRLLYIKPCLLAHGCGRWVYPLVVLVVVYKLKFKNITYGITLSLNWYGNASLEYLLTTFLHRYSHGAWWFRRCLSTLFSIYSKSLVDILICLYTRTALTVMFSQA